MDTLSKVQLIESAIAEAEGGSSKIDEHILNIDGMSSDVIRHFLNNLCDFEDCRYLEIGCWKGSTITSALFRNKMTAVCADNFSQFVDEEILDKDRGWLEYPSRQEVREELIRNIEHGTSKGLSECIFLEKSFDDIDLGDRKFNVYLYDGDHCMEDQKQGLLKMLPWLEDEFIFLVDDYALAEPQVGTEMAIMEGKLTAVKEWVMGANRLDENFHSGFKPNGGWWNGYYIGILRKN